MTFNMCNLGSKYPYFRRTYVLSGGLGWTHLYIFDWRVEEEEELELNNMPLKLRAYRYTG